jgi:hypothetical protein
MSKTVGPSGRKLTNVVEKVNVNICDEVKLMALMVV